ncbi:IDEAL domain-containing protein [Rossellomorea vietnamensis]|uniref:IDEAL domain-containing protein n=2 Tax=Rossellomorea TaxID=2837508 RepID=A0A5D4KM69_9BACI|nr:MULTISPECIES: IDEAL domain-containing protein [Rossellomorea]TYR77855.1 IDEAL domain-containing protein [Rossellomorea vietnamensis]TYS83315.1 IDEAL domain-containing protein [Rossellomorea aquimaris]
MDKKKTYSEMMKACAMSRKTATDMTLTEIYVDMILNELNLVNQKRKLQEELDSALDQRDKKKFMALSQQLKKMTEKYGI